MRWHYMRGCCRQRPEGCIEGRGRQAVGEQDGLVAPAAPSLFEEGLQDQAYHLLSKPDDPGWGYMIAQGAETMWEGWDDIESHCHAWNGYPARLLQEYVCGIQSGAPGFATAQIRPFSRRIWTLPRLPFRP